MFESALLEKLKSDTELLSYVSSFAGQPAIFSEFAPEAVEMPYIVFRISRNATDNLPVQEFTINIDYYDFEKSSQNSRKSSERMEFILDRAELNHERYDIIRLFFVSGSQVEQSDPRAIFHRMQFSGRAARKKWIEQL
jgi:hypothetical protein